MPHVAGGVKSYRIFIPAAQALFAAEPQFLICYITRPPSTVSTCPVM